MACCTYLTDQEFKDYSKVEDADLNDVFQELRAISTDWYLQERKYPVSRGWFRKPRIETKYSVFKTTMKPEVQQINFYLDNNGDYSINFVVKKEIVMAYFFGLIGNRS